MKHSLGTAVDIFSYYGTNYYTTPSDGYVRAESGTNANNRVTVFVDDISLTIARCSVTGYSDIRTVFVKKGSKVNRHPTDNAGSLLFYPLV